MKKKPFRKFYTQHIILANLAWLIKNKPLIYICHLIALNKIQENNIKNNLENMGFKIIPIFNKVLQKHQNIYYPYIFNGNSFVIEPNKDYFFHNFFNFFINNNEENDISSCLQITHIISKGKIYAINDLIEIITFLTKIDANTIKNNALEANFLQQTFLSLTKNYLLFFYKKIIITFLNIFFYQLKKNNGNLQTSK